MGRDGAVVWSSKLKTIALLLVCTAIVLLWSLASCTIGAPLETYYYTPTPGPDEVKIHAHYVQVPVGRILLIRKGPESCAIKFIKYWTGKNKDDHFGQYERYYQGDGSGDFTKPDVKFETDDVADPRVRGNAAFPFQFGKKDLRCGSIQVRYMGDGHVTFITPGQRYDIDDARIELAPTPWTTLAEVNINDPRIKWYRIDPHRKSIIILIDRIWNQSAAGSVRSGEDVFIPRKTDSGK